LKKKYLFIALFTSFISGVLFYRYEPFPYQALEFVIKPVFFFAKKVIRPEVTKVLDLKEYKSLDSRVNTNITPFQKTMVNISPEKIAVCSYKEGYLVLNKNLDLMYFKSKKLIFEKNISPFSSSQSSNISRINDLFCNGNEQLFFSFTVGSSSPEFNVARIINIENIDNLYSSIEYSLKNLHPFAPRSGRIMMFNGKLLASLSSESVDEGYMSTTAPYFGAQDPNAPHGKIIELIKPDKFKVYTMGNREPQGFFIVDDLIFETEHGPRGGDELNIIEAGKNYGWPLTTDGMPYKSNAPLFGERARHSDEFEIPLFSWNPSIGISQGIYLDEFSLNEWNGDILIGTLKERSIYRIRLSKDKKSVKYIEKIWIGQRIRDIASNKKNIVITTDSGNLIWLDPILDEEFKFIRAEFEDDAFLTACLSCHGMNQTNQIAPKLSKLFNRNVASDPSFKYSEGILKYKNNKWTKELFLSYLSNPNKTFPGTSMNYQVNDLQEREKIYLELLKESSSPPN